MVENQLKLLIEDLKKSAQERRKNNKGCFSEELVILRLEEILKAMELEEVLKELKHDGYVI